MIHWDGLRPNPRLSNVDVLWSASTVVLQWLLLLETLYTTHQVLSLMDTFPHPTTLSSPTSQLVSRESLLFLQQELLKSLHSLLLLSLLGCQLTSTTETTVLVGSELTLLTLKRRHAN